MLDNILLNNKGEIHSNLLKENIVDYGKKTFKFPVFFSYRLLRLSPKHIARPDKLSQDLYGSDIYGDVICKVNNIPNPFELNDDEIIVVPTLESLDDFLFNGDDAVDEEDVSLPKPKNKKEKRKSSDSIIGDTRFKIDNTKRVIIY